MSYKTPLKLATAGNEQAIIGLINKFYYSTSCSVNIKTGEVSNKFGIINGVEVIIKKGRYVFQTKPAPSSLNKN